MATSKPDTDTRALLDALCEWVVNDLNFMPVAAAKLRERFEKATTAHGILHRLGRDTKEVTYRQET